MKIIYTLLFGCAFISCQRETKKNELKKENTPTANAVYKSTKRKYRYFLYTAYPLIRLDVKKRYQPEVTSLFK